MRSADVAVVALAFVAFANAATIQSDSKALSEILRCAGAKSVTDSELLLAVTALQGLTTCIQRNAAGLPGIQGWGVNTSFSAALNANASVPIPTPGVKSSSESAPDPCSEYWTGIGCTATSSGDTVTFL